MVMEEGLLALIIALGTALWNLIKFIVDKTKEKKK